MKQARKWVFGSDELIDSERAFFNELRIRQAIRRAHMSGDTNTDYIGLKAIARAISDGIGKDLPTLIKELQVYEKR